MPKMKTHRGAAKRFKKTGTGKLQRNHAFHSHILTKKSPGRKAELGGRDGGVEGEREDREADDPVPVAAAVVQSDSAASTRARRGNHHS